MWHHLCRKRQAKELAALGFGEKEAESAEGKKPDDMDTLIRAIAGTSAGQQRGPSKAQKRRDAKMKQEVEREQRIQQEQSGVVSERVIENQRLAEKLSPLGLALKEIKPDGHCLYRAVEDQLQVRGERPLKGTSCPDGDALCLLKLCAPCYDHEEFHNPHRLPSFEGSAFPFLSLVRQKEKHTKITKAGKVRRTAFPSSLWDVYVQVPSHERCWRLCVKSREFLPGHPYRIRTFRNTLCVKRRLLSEKFLGRYSAIRQ